MHFKSLELLGFKSFADKTKLNFEPGVTAIVGPNGCGKSNIADSIRWVLGEQSAKSLRASNMQDVIFNGTDTKEPINFAEVSLSFSNEKRILPIDYDEVIITRRIFRSGETEYLLNKTPVRLKDISELLMGTGIGTESYSIIEQGKMDLVLSSKPEDRRYVFEEASGITKYKSKKKEALRKLEQTEQNLLRISDIIQEVKRQITSIERQARKAERYKVDFDKLKDLEVKLSFSEYKNLKTQEKTYSVESDDAKVRERDLDAEIKAIASNISNYRQSLDEVSQNMLELRNRYTELSGSVDMNTQKITIDKERIEEARALQESVKKEFESTAEKLQSVKALIEKLKEGVQKVASERLAKQKLIEEKELLLNDLSKAIEETENKVNVSKVQIVDHLAKETRIKNELIKLGADIQNRRARQRRLHVERETVQKELGQIEEVLRGIVEEFKGLEDRLSALRSDLDSKKRLNESVISEIKSIEDSLAREETNKAGLRSKIEILEDNIKRYEGFSLGVKSLFTKSSEASPSFGMLGVLAEIIKVHKGYEEAVSTFLGDDAQVIIAEKDSDITKMIDYLKENKLGKASFVSLETLNRINRINQPARPSVNFAPLKNFVNTEPRYGAILEHFFANAYLAESLDEVLKGLDGSSGSATIVTKLGLMCDNGKISGGSVSEASESLLIGRRHRLEDLKAELKNIEDSIMSIEASCKEKRDHNKALEAEIGTLDASVHAEDINFANIKSKKDTQEENAKKLKEEFELLASELEEAGQTIDELTGRGESLNAELNDIEKEKSGTQNFIDEAQLSVTNKRSEKEKETIAITTLRAEMQSFEKEEENAQNNLKSQEAVAFEFEETLYSRESLLKESVERTKSLEEEIVRLTGQNTLIEHDLKALNEQMSEIEKTRSDAMDKLSIAELQSKEKEKQIESLRNQIRDLDVKLAEVNYRKTNLKDRISQAYKVDLENIHIELEDNIDWDSIKSQVTELKERLEKMGPVNLIAIDEHKELEERYAFLVHQQEDLLNAKDSLHKAIQKINKTTKELFIETFQKIQIEFKNFFKLLFGGGQAELVLIDEQDILESGVEIIVRPPGKKLQNIMLLSGGEKALTAIALLFAIFKVKPSPFCVLDEIDAPLDESNINRFSNVLKDFMKISQFIIITHNKRTIELADIMYGITMQERGVSKIVSVKFSDSKEKKEPQKSAAPVAS